MEHALDWAVGVPERVVGALERTVGVLERTVGVLEREAEHAGASRGLQLDNFDLSGWWFVALERCCQSQLVADAAGTPIEIPDELCQDGYDAQGHELAGWFQFQPWWDELVRDEPDFLD